MYESRNFAAMPVLADALEDAGGDRTDVIAPAPRQTAAGKLLVPDCSSGGRRVSSAGRADTLSPAGAARRGPPPSTRGVPMRLARPFCRLGAPAALLAGMFAAAPHAVVGQPPPGRAKGMTEIGQVQAGAHRVRLEAGKMYWVRVEGKGFTPRVAVHPGGLSPLQGAPGQPGGPVLPGLPGQPGLAAPVVGPNGPPGPVGGGGRGNVFEGLIDPKESREYRVLVTANPDGDLTDQSPGYELTVTPLTPILDREDRTTPTDPRYQNGAVSQGPHKEYPVQFKAGQTCIITLDTTQPGGGFDPYLVLEGPGGDVVAQNDDGGQGNNSRIVHRSKRGGEYRGIATGLGGGTGAYRVRVIAASPDGGGKAAPAPDAPRDSR